MDKLKVVMIGPDGCGKTIYLAVLLQQTFVAGPENGWRLHPVKPQQAMFLNQTYATLTDPATLNFPPPTLRGALIDYEFQTRVSGTRIANEYTPLELSYLDFPGDIVYREQEGEITDVFARHVEKADVVMGLFDGLDVLRMMQDNDRSPNQCLQPKYGNLLFWLVRNEHQNRSPIHFVVTKWDLLEAEGFSLADVKAKLMKFQEFVKFAGRDIKRYDPETHENEHLVYPPAYLVPVSAVGRGFATLKGDQMVKVGLSEVHPEDITLPLALAVFDGIRTRLESSASTAQYSDTIKDIITSVASVIEEVVPTPMRLILRAGTELLKWLDKRHTKNKRLNIDWLRWTRARYRNGELKVTDEHSAQEALVSDLALQIAEFQAAHRESRLTYE